MASKTITVGDESIEADRVIIATGASPSVPLTFDKSVDQLSCCAG